MARCHPAGTGTGTGPGQGTPARGRWPEPCACRWGHYVLFVFLFLGWQNKQGSGFSAVSLQLTNRAHHSAGVAHSVRGDGAGTERGASLNLRGGWEEVMTQYFSFFFFFFFAATYAGFCACSLWKWGVQACMNFSICFPQFRMVHSWKQPLHRVLGCH